MKRFISRFFRLAAVFLILWLAGCGPDEPVRIGFLGGVSGRVADLGMSGRDAVQMAVEDCNKQGGISGRPVELIVKDDRQDPVRAQKLAGELIDSRVAAIIGPMTSDMAMAVKPVLDKAEVAAVSPTVSTPQLLGKDDYFFRVVATSKAYAVDTADYHVRKKTMSKVCVIYDLSNRSYCESWLKYFSQRFTAGGGQVIGTTGFDSAVNRSFLKLVTEVLARAPDGILIIANSMDAALLCQQIRKFNMEIPITLSEWGATERLLELGGKAVEGVTLFQVFDRNFPGKSYQAFRARYLERFGREPGFPGVLAYDAAQVVLTALGQKKDQPLKDALIAIRRFEGLQGEILFDEYGDIRGTTHSIDTIRDNQFVVLE